MIGLPEKRISNLVTNGGSKPQGPRSDTVPFMEPPTRLSRFAPRYRLSAFDIRALHLAMRRAFILLTGLICAALWQPAAQAETSRVFDPERAGWTRAELTASKYFLSMNASVEVEAVNLSSLEGLLVTPLADEERQRITIPLRLSYVTDGLGRRNENQLLLDGRLGFSIQRTSLRLGGSPKYRTYRFEQDEILRLTRRPAETEQELPPELWSRISEEAYAYPADASNSVVAEAGALIYLAAASPLNLPGDRVDILTLASDEFFVASLVVGNPNNTNVDYVILENGSGSRRTGRLAALSIAIEAQPLAAAPDEDFELFGMTDLELLLDPETRAPLELRGHVDYFGDVVFRLQRVTLASNAAD